MYYCTRFLKYFGGVNYLTLLHCYIIFENITGHVISAHCAQMFCFTVWGLGNGILIPTSFVKKVFIYSLQGNAINISDLNLPLSPKQGVCEEYIIKWSPNMHLHSLKPRDSSLEPLQKVSAPQKPMPEFLPNVPTLLPGSNCTNKHHTIFHAYHMLWCLNCSILKSWCNFICI